MPSEWDGYLEGLARAVDDAVDDESLVLTEVVERVLRAKLLPLLEAGQAMRMTFPYYGGPKATWLCKEAWDAAREAALKGSA